MGRERGEILGERREEKQRRKSNNSFVLMKSENNRKGRKVYIYKERRNDGAGFNFWERKTIDGGTVSQSHWKQKQRDAYVKERKAEMRAAMGEGGKKQTNKGLKHDFAHTTYGSLF